MDFDAISGNFPIIGLIAALIILQFLFGRRRKPAATHQQIIQNLLMEVRLNQAMLESYHQLQKPKKFEVNDWKRSRDKIDFLGQGLQRSLSDAYMIIEDFNQQIDEAKRYKSVGYMASVNPDKLKEPLAKCRQGLEEWLLASTAANPPKRPGIFDELLGRD
ncbi:hypothetical protein ACFLTY_05045 [Chloroflexota bacterium]